MNEENNNWTSEKFADELMARYSFSDSAKDCEEHGEELATYIRQEVSELFTSLKQSLAPEQIDSLADKFIESTPNGTDIVGSIISVARKIGEEFIKQIDNFGDETMKQLNDFFNDMEHGNSPDEYYKPERVMGTIINAIKNHSLNESQIREVLNIFDGKVYRIKEEDSHLDMDFYVDFEEAIKTLNSGGLDALKEHYEKRYKECKELAEHAIATEKWLDEQEREDEEERQAIRREMKKEDLL